MAKSGFTNSFIQTILRYLFGNVAMTAPVNWYVGASTTPINQDGTGATEPTDPAYARILVNNNTASWEDIPADFGRRNLSGLAFPTATVNQGTITYIFLADTLTGNTIRCYGELIVPKPITVDDVLKIDATNLQIKFLPTV